jgi:pilus assembly protein Flp/PilA
MAKLFCSNRSDRKGEAAMLAVSRRLRRFAADEAGVTAIEYGLIAAATGLGVAAAMPMFASKMDGMYDRILNYFG